MLDPKGTGAERLKCKTAIAQVEGAFYPASDDLISLIARETELPPAFFSRETAPSFPLGSLLFRAHGPITRRQRVETYRHAQLVYEILLFLYSRRSNSSEYSRVY